MNFEPEPEIEALLERIRAFVNEQLAPIEVECLSRPFFEIEPLLAERRREVKASGLWAPQLSTELGGLGLGLVDYGLVSEQLGGYPFAHYVFGCQAPDAGNLEVLQAHGDPAQRAEFLAPLATGEIRSCFAMTERDYAGSNPTLLGTTATRVGDQFVVDGRKWYSTAADGAAFAVVMAVTDAEAPAHQRASMILVPTTTPGFEIVRNISVMGHAGEGWASHSELRLSGCRVPVGNLLGTAGHGFAIAQERLGPGRIHHCMRWLGICRRMFDLLCQRAVSRDLGGGRMLGEQDIVRAWIAECAAEMRAARLMTLHTAWLIERHGWRAARQDVSAIKFLVANVMQKVIDRALQVHGALGMSDDTPIAFFYREERASRIYDGPDEVHKLSLAKRILREYSATAEPPTL